MRAWSRSTSSWTPPGRIALPSPRSCFAAPGKPTILMLTHDLGGGVRRHINELVERIAGQANVLLLESTARGAALIRAGVARPSANWRCRPNDWPT